MFQGQKSVLYDKEFKAPSALDWVVMSPLNNSDCKNVEQVVGATVNCTVCTVSLNIFHTLDSALCTIQYIILKN